MNHASQTAAAARDGAVSLTSNIYDKVSSVNYTEHFHAVKSSGAVQSLLKKTELAQPYVEKAKPILDKAKNMCQPVLQQAEPVFTKAKEVCEPLIAQAVEKCSSAF